MAETTATTGQVAVYIDFDNIVISRYDELHGRQAFRDDKAHSRNPSTVVQRRLREARIDLDAVINFASSFGNMAISRAYANWASPLHASYADQTLRRSIDLVQMFPMTGTKNGADIRLAIDVIDDLSRYPGISHVVVVAGDSDYVSLAQRCKRLGRRVIGIGAAGSAGRYWQHACDEFRFYGNVPGVATADEEPVQLPVQQVTPGADSDAEALLVQAAQLLALRTEGDWLTAGVLKNQMMRLAPSFSESTLGFGNFSSFLRAMPHLLEVRDAATSGHEVRLLAPPGADADPAQALSPADDAPVEELAPRLAALRVKLVSLPRPFTIAAEAACVAAIRATWSLLEPDLPRQGQVPRDEILAAMWAAGIDPPTAKWAAHAVSTSGFPSVLHDSEQLLLTNPELTSLDDAQLLAQIRRWAADRARNFENYRDVAAEDLVLALYGTSPPDGAEEDIATALDLSSVDSMRRALGPRLVAPLVLWDLSDVLAQLGDRRVGLTAESFPDAVTPGLLALEREADTFPMSAAFLAASDAGACSAETEVHDYTDVAGPILRLWARQLLGDGHLVPHEMTSMEAFYRLALPDRMSAPWRGWVRDLVSSEQS